MRLIICINLPAITAICRRSRKLRRFRSWDTTPVFLRRMLLFLSN